MLADAYNLPIFLGQNAIFGHLTEEQLGLVIETAQQRLYPKGKQIYELGNDAAEFFLIYSGRVQLIRLVDGITEYDATLEPSDWFGEEALGVTPLRQTTTSAIEDTIVLVFDADVLNALRLDLPLLDMRLRRLQESFTLMWSAPIGWRQPGEAIYFIARRHFFFLLTHMLPPAGVLFLALITLVLWRVVLPDILTPLLVAGLLAAVAAAWGIWNYIDWSNDYYIITDRRIIYLEHIILLYDSRSEAPLDAILAVSHRTGLVGRWLGFGNITVKSYTGTVRFLHIARPQEVQAFIQTMLLRARQQQRRQQTASIDSTIQERLNPPPPATTPSPDANGAEDAEVEFQPGVLQTLLARLFHIRLEVNGVITYRKHWFILLLNIWAPTLILLGLLVALILNIVGILTFISLVGMLALVFLLGLVVSIWWLYQYVDWRNDVYVVTNDEIVDVYKKPLGTETRKAAPIKNILSIEYRRLGFIGYLLNYGTVFIKVGETTFDFDYVFNPSEVQRELFQKFSEFKYREKQAEEQAEAQRMADWIERYDHYRQQNQQE